MTAQVIVASVLAALAVGSFSAAIVSERRMQRHRQPGVSYADVTLRRDGAWRRADLFTPEGLAHQRRAARFGFYGLALTIAALASWVVIGNLG